MDILVCIKQVPDTESKIVINSESNGIVTEGIKYVMNPYDEFAVEEALKIKENIGGTVTIVCMGPQRSKEVIRSALAMGADTGLHLNDVAFEGSDSYSTAMILASAIKSLSYDIILCGKQAVDLDNAQVYAALGELLGISHVSIVTKLDISDDRNSVIAERDIEGGDKELIQTSLPAIIACQKGINEPRIASLRGIMQAKKKSIDEYDLSKMDLSAENVGVKGSKVNIRKYTSPPQRGACKIIDGETNEIVSQIVQLFRDELKVV